MQNEQQYIVYRRIIDKAEREQNPILCIDEDNTNNTMHNEIKYGYPIEFALETAKIMNDIDFNYFNLWQFNKHITDNHIRNNVDVFTDYKDYWHSTRN